jgi:hypothetical protein
VGGSRPALLPAYVFKSCSRLVPQTPAKLAYEAMRVSSEGGAAESRMAESDRSGSSSRVLVVEQTGGTRGLEFKSRHPD